MISGWYRITMANGLELIARVEKDSVDGKSVAKYQGDGCIFEEVEILTKREITKRIEDGVREGLRPFIGG